MDTASDVPTPSDYPFADAGRLPPFRARERGTGGEGYATHEAGGRAYSAHGSASDGHTAEVPAHLDTEAVAQWLLAAILALDLGTMTPIRALTLLHELQTQAREAVPWSSWMASLAGGVPYIPPAPTIPEIPELPRER